MFDFENELVELRKQKAAKQAEMQAEEDRKDKIRLELAQNASSFFTKNNLLFRIEINKPNVDVVSADGRVLTVEINRDGTFSVKGGASDIDSKYYIKRKEISAKETMRTIIGWVMQP